MSNGESMDMQYYDTTAVKAQALHLHKNIQRALTLLTNILHSRNELLLEVVAVFGDLLTLFQKVLGSLLNRHCQDMGLLGAPLLLTGWPFVAGVHQGSHLGKEERSLQLAE